MGNDMKIYYELLEDRIKTLRMHAGDSQQDLADAIGSQLNLSYPTLPSIRTMHISLFWIPRTKI